MMNHRFTDPFTHSPKLMRQAGFAFLMVLLLSLGVWFRVANLGQKVFWVDEVATVIRAVGYTKAEVTAELADGRLYAPTDLLSYQHLMPDRGLSDTIHALARSPEHAPLYFLLVRCWMQLFGSSVSAVRSLSVASGLLVLPCIYWLGRILFGSVPAGWLAMLLTAISPFFVAYAQEARPYSFWLLMIVVNNTTLLRALRYQSRGSWAIYALTLTANLYTSLLSLLLLIGQGIYVAKREPSTTLRRFLGYAAVAVMAFLPWVWVMGQHWAALGANTTWMRTALNPLVMVAIWLYSFAVLFFDVPVVVRGWVALAQAGIAASVLAIMGYAIYWLRKLPRQANFLLLSLCLPIPAVLISLDLLFQGQASATTRYLMPTQFGGLLATAGCLAMPLVRAASPQFQPVRRILCAFLIGLSLISCLTNLNRSPQYQKDRNRANPAIAALLNQTVNSSPQPTVLAEPEQTLDLLSLSHHLDPATQIQILPIEQVSTVAATPPCQRFLFNPSAALLTVLQQQPALAVWQRYQPDLLTPADRHLSLWMVQSMQCQPIDLQE